MNEECLIYKEPLNTSTPTKKWNVCFAIIQAVKFTSEKLHIDMKQNAVICTRSPLNNQCRQEKRPFHKNYTEY